MSDALTDIKRDQDIGKILTEIAILQKQFEENPDKTKAKELIALWKEFSLMPRGYWTQSNRKLAVEKIRKYEKYLAEGE